MAGEVPHSTPQKKDRHIERATESGLEACLDSAEDKDFIFVQKCLCEKPRLTALVASWLRDGELDKALAHRDSRRVTKVLGEKLPPKCKKLKSIPPRVWKSLWARILDLPVGTSFEPDDEEVMTSHEIINMCYYALRCSVRRPQIVSQVYELVALSALLPLCPVVSLQLLARAAYARSHCR